MFKSAEYHKDPEDNITMREMETGDVGIIVDKDTQFYGAIIMRLFGDTAAIIGRYYGSDNHIGDTWTGLRNNKIKVRPLKGTLTLTFKG